MRSFTCPTCGQLVSFESFSCLRCGTDLGFDVGQRELVGLSAGGPRSRCANQELAVCNWLIEDPGPALCVSCALTRTRPHEADLRTDATVGAAFADAEAAKRRLVFQLLEIGLAVPSWIERPDDGLAFDLLSSAVEAVTIGHADGLITIDLAESDDAHREQVRQQLGEPYRTMLGHLRHETGHYYWQQLVAPDPATLTRYRELFGDEREDYAEALEHHYHRGPAPGWEQTHVSGYAAAHPWEDFAESFAHYLHIRDTLQTAASFGLVVTGASPDPSLIAAPSLEPEESFETILATWLPLTYALNAINRSMGRGDLYPFVLAPVVMSKLSFVHRCVTRAALASAP